MGLVDLAKYTNSRVGAIFYQDHADRIIEMASQIVAELNLQFVSQEKTIADLNAQLDSQKQSTKDEQTEKEPASKSLVGPGSEKPDGPGPPTSDQSSD